MRSTDPDFGPARTTDPAVSTASQPVLRRQRRDVTHRFEALVQLAPDATVVVDAKGRIRLVNRQTEKLFGYSADELLGQPVELLIPERLRALHQHHRADYTAAPHLRPMGSSLPLSGRRRDGSEFPLEASLGPLDEGGELLVIVSIRDITERQRLEQERDEAREEVQEVQAITDTALSHLELADLLRALLSRLQTLMVVDDVAILLLEEDGQQLLLSAARGPDEAEVGRLRIPVGQGITGRIAATRAPLMVDDLASIKVVYPSLVREFLRSVVGVPMLVEQRLVGVVCVGNATPRHFTEQEVQLLQKAADRMAFAIDRAQLYRSEQQARKTLAERVAQLEAVMEAVPEILTVYDTAGRVVLANAAHQEQLARFITQIPPGETLRQRFEQLGGIYHTQGVKFEEAEWPQTRVLRGEVLTGANAVELTARAPQGELATFSVTGVPLRDIDGRIIGAVTASRDITEHKRLEHERIEQAEQLDRIFEGIADGVGVYDTQARLVRLNAAAHRILGLDPVPADYAQRPLADRVSLFEARDEQDCPVAHEDWPLMRVLSGQATGADIREIRMRTLDGRDVELSISVAPLRDEAGRLTGAVGIFRDQTEQKRLAREEERARAHEKALEDTTRHMDEFLATASHDLRTPLTVVKSRVQIALRRLRRLRDSAAAPPDALSETDLEALHASLLEANQSADHLTRLVAMLFDVSRARSGTLELRLAPCDLAALVRKNVTAQQTAVPERRINLEVPEALVPVEADADRLDQVLSNYLTNALKYSSADQPVTVKLEVVEDQAVVSVADHGPGLPPEEQTRIWEVFHRAPGIEVQSGNTEVSGSLGLGLHICKQLIELHPGGSVGVESTVGEGSTFWFRLPLVS